jgi:hypothetical protein
MLDACPFRSSNMPEMAAEAVHSSLVWFLQATLSYSKRTQGIEQVRRPIVVNAL